MHVLLDSCCLLVCDFSRLVGCQQAKSVVAASVYSLPVVWPAGGEETVAYRGKGQTHTSRMA